MLHSQMDTLNRRNNLGTSYSSKDQRILGYEKLFYDMFTSSIDEWETQSGSMPDFAWVWPCCNTIFFCWLVPEYSDRREVPIVMPGSSPDLPWPDTRCDYGLFSWYDLEHATKPSTIRAHQVHFFRRSEDDHLLCVPHFTVEFRDDTQVSPNNRLMFLLGSALKQASQIGLDPPSYAAYGACVDLSTSSVIFQGMTTLKVCSPLHIKSRVAHETIRTTLLITWLAFLCQDTCIWTIMRI